MSAFVDSYDLVIVGSGFASMFYLEGALKKPNGPKRILVIEFGRFENYAERLMRQINQSGDSESEQASGRKGAYFLNRTPEKPWTARIAFGGGSNCWFGSTPRILPSDFKMKANFGVGEDWPITYDELEPFYCEAEEMMQISGSSDMPYPMSRPYPLGPHRFSEPDQALKNAYPDRFFVVPTARASEASRRAGCCNNGVCFMCPVDAKFTVENGLQKTYQNAQVRFVYETEVTRLEHQGDRVTGVVCKKDGREFAVKADRVVLGANAISNPYILLRSGIDHPETGRGLCEQAGVKVQVTLEGMKNFQGSTVTTGWGVNDLFGDHRRHRAGFMFNTVNRAMNLSLDPRSPFSDLEIIVAVEDFRRADNRVTFEEGVDRPVVRFNGVSELTGRTLRELPAHQEKILSVLPVKKMNIIPDGRKTESHIQCTVPMGDDPRTSVVDRHGIHHGKRNLWVLGSGMFPTASPPNPSLTISALSLFSAHHTA